MIKILFNLIIFRLCLPVWRFFNLLNKPTASDHENVLIISLFYIGDVLFATPAIAGIKKAYPNVEIDLFVNKTSVPILQGNSNVSNIFVDPIPHTVVNSINTLKTKLLNNCATLKALRKKKYSTILDFTGSFESALYCGIIAAPECIGVCYDTIFSSVYTSPLLVSSRATAAHLKRLYLDVTSLAFSEIDKTSANLEVEVSELEKRKAKEFLTAYNADNPVLIAPFAGWKNKEWQTKKFVETANALSKAGFSVFFIGTHKDSVRLESVLPANNALIHNVCGKTTLRETIALISYSSLVIGGDSSPAHIAEALHTPSIVLFGATNPVYSAPESQMINKVIYLPQECSAQADKQYCSEDPLQFICPHGIKCLESILVDDVVVTAINLLTMSK